MDDSVKDNPNPLVIELEPPPAPETPTAGLGTLISEDNFVLTTARLSVAEVALSLLTRDITFDDFCRELLLAIMKVMKCEASSILELDQKNAVFFFRSMTGKSSDQLCHFRIPMNQGIVGYVADSKQPLRVDNIEENALHLKSIGNAVGFEARNLIAVPVLIRGQIYGVMEFLNRVGEENFTPIDQELLVKIAELVSKAVEIRMMFSWIKSQGSSGSPQMTDLGTPENQDGSEEKVA